MFDPERSASKIENGLHGRTFSLFDLNFLDGFSQYPFNLWL